jgi:serine/threonine protein kinase
MKRELIHEAAEHTSNIGTPVYMAPELHTGSGKQELRADLTDVYSFGIMMWAVLARERPYRKEVAERGLNLWKLNEFIGGGGRPSVDDHPLIQTAPVGAVLLMQQCWEQDPLKRPSGFDEIHARLGKVLSYIGSRQEAPEPEPSRLSEQSSAVYHTNPMAGSNNNSKSQTDEAGFKRVALGNADVASAEAGEAGETDEDGTAAGNTQAKSESRTGLRSTFSVEI